MIGTPLEGHGSYVDSIELPCEITFTPGPLCGLVDPVVVNFPPSWTGRKWNNNGRIWLYNIFPHTRQYNTVIDMEINLQMPNVGIVSSVASEPGTWKWLNSVPSGSSYGQLHVVIYMDDYSGAFCSLAEDWSDPVHTIKILTVDLGTPYKTNHGLQVECCGFPVVVMDGDDDLDKYRVPPQGLYQCTTRLTPFNCDIGPLYGVLQGQQFSGNRLAPYAPTGSTKFLTPPMTQTLETYHRGLKLTLDMDLVPGVPSTWPKYATPPDNLDYGYIANGSNPPITGEGFSRPYHLGEVIAFDAVAHYGINTHYGPYPIQ